VHEMQTVVIDVGFSVCQSLCFVASLSRHGRTDQGAAWGGDSWGP